MELVALPKELEEAQEGTMGSSRQFCSLDLWYGHIVETKGRKGGGETKPNKRLGEVCTV